MDEHLVFMSDGPFLRPVKVDDRPRLFGEGIKFPNLPYKQYLCVIPGHGNFSLGLFIADRETEHYELDSFVYHGGPVPVVTQTPLFEKGNFSHSDSVHADVILGRTEEGRRHLNITLDTFVKNNFLYRSEFDALVVSGFTEVRGSGVGNPHASPPAIGYPTYITQVVLLKKRN